MLIQSDNTRVGCGLGPGDCRLLSMIETHLRLADPRFDPDHLQVGFAQDLIRIFVAGKLSNIFLINLLAHGSQSLLLKLIGRLSGRRLLLIMFFVCLNFFRIGVRVSFDD